jgi:hypothetical protein
MKPKAIPQMAALLKALAEIGLTAAMPTPGAVRQDHTKWVPAGNRWERDFMYGIVRVEVCVYTAATDDKGRPLETEAEIYRLDDNHAGEWLGGYVFSQHENIWVADRLALSKLFVDEVRNKF